MSPEHGVERDHASEFKAFLAPHIEACSTPAKLEEYYLEAVAAGESGSTVWIVDPPQGETDQLRLRLYAHGNPREVARLSVNTRALDALLALRTNADEYILVTPLGASANELRMQAESWTAQQD